MKVVKNANLDKYDFSRGRFCMNTILMGEIMKLGVNDVIEVGKDDFQGKSQTPIGIMGNLHVTLRKKKDPRKFSLRTLQGKEKWLIIRVK